MKKKKKRSKGRKSLAAVSAVVAAGLAPGVASGSPAQQPVGPDVELTAADIVSINGEVFDFDELFAMHQVNRDQRNPPKVYGPPPSAKEKEERARQEAMREQARQDSIRRARDRQSLVYGPPAPVYGPPESFEPNLPEQARLQAISMSKEDAIDNIQNELKSLIELTLRVKNKPASISPETDISRDLGLNAEELRELMRDVDFNFGVQITDEMLQQLNTLPRLAKFIIAVIRPDED